MESKLGFLFIPNPEFLLSLEPQFLYSPYNQVFCYILKNPFPLYMCKSLSFIVMVYYFSYVLSCCFFPNPTLCPSRGA